MTECFESEYPLWALQEFCRSRGSSDPRNCTCKMSNKGGFLSNGVPRPARTTAFSSLQDSRNEGDFQYGNTKGASGYSARYGTQHPISGDRCTLQPICKLCCASILVVPPGQTSCNTCTIWVQHSIKTKAMRHIKDALLVCKEGPERDVN